MVGGVEGHPFGDFQSYFAFGCFWPQKGRHFGGHTLHHRMDVIRHGHIAGVRVRCCGLHVFHESGQDELEPEAELESESEPPPAAI